jgi:hypothetical protein
VPSETRILLVGDWFVDDHWVVGEHRSSTSSRTGKRHLAALQDPHSATESLCGAGRTASVLLGAGFRTFGAGICALSDEKVLLSLLRHGGEEGRNPHTLRRWSRDPESKPKEAKFRNLGDADCGTSRAIRIYEREGDKTVLTQRLDWETEDHSVGKEGLQKLSEFVDDLGGRKRLDAVVIKDLAKGFVGPKLVETLIDRLGELPWFVSTKDWRPPWFEILREEEVDVRLLVVPEMAARKAVGRYIDAEGGSPAKLSSWIVGPDEPSKGALDIAEKRLLRSRTGAGTGIARTVVIVPNDWTVLALNTDDEGYVHRRKRKEELVPTAFASVLLGALTGRMLCHGDQDLAGLVGGAASYSYDWRHFETGRVIDYLNWNPDDEPPDDLKKDSAADDYPCFSWSAARDRWNDAYTAQNVGILDLGDSRASDSEGDEGTDRGECRLELWRAMTELPGYICLVRQKRETVAALVDMLRSFERSDRSRQESCLLIAPPGAGKTRLVQCLAEREDFHPLSFDITHLYEPAGLLDCFDRISTTQAQVRDKPLLIFFDEINSTVAGHPVYASFLTPLAEGFYVRAEKSFQIQPAVWLFAGTAFNLKSAKAEDFLSRLTRGIFSLEESKDESEARSADLERTYLGAALLKSVFEEIEVISEDVLDFFQRLPRGISNRKMAELARQFHNVRHREVTRENIPWDWVHQNIRFQAGSAQSDREFWRYWRDSWKSHVPGPRDVRIIEKESPASVD